MTMILKGVHGTKTENINSIKSIGFKSFPGMKGTGIYFWKESIYARDLAINWVKFRKNSSKGHKISVINTNLKADSLDILEERDIHEAIVENMNIDQVRNYRTADKLGPLYNYMIKQLEKETRHKMKIIIVEVGIPVKNEHFSFYNMNLFGAPTTYIAREKEVIEITNIENVEN